MSSPSEVIVSTQFGSVSSGFQRESLDLVKGNHVRKPSSSLDIVRRPRRLGVVLAAVITATALTACSSPSTDQASGSSSGGGCTAPTDYDSVLAQKVAGPASDYNLTSYDGTLIRLHWFPLSVHTGSTKDAPTVFMGPGWGESGSTATASTGIFGSLDIASLWKAGYNVMTWDPRGFGQSKGTIEIDSSMVEGHDVSQIISWVSRQKGVEVDGTGDPRMGMVGASYGGGIQFATAATDCRVDAIAPTIAWHSLTTSLEKNGTPKIGWASILMGSAAGRNLDPKITAANADASGKGITSAASEAFFASRGPAPYLSKVTVPTLIIQGTVDDLFPLAEGTANYEALKKAGTTVSMVWFCGGHGACLTNPGVSNDVGAYSIAWMDRYVKRDTSARVIKGFRFVDQNGTIYDAPTWPLTHGPSVSASGAGSLPLTEGGGSGPAAPSTIPGAGASAIDSVALGVTPAKASNALNVSIAFSKAVNVVGAPSLTLTYSGTSKPGERPGRVFAQLVDPSTGLVVNNQITPIPVTLDGKTHSITLPLEIIAFTAAAGDNLQLQLTPTTVAYSNGRLGGNVNFSKISIVLPTATGLTVVSKAG